MLEDRATPPSLSRRRILQGLCGGACGGLVSGAQAGAEGSEAVCPVPGPDFRLLVCNDLHFFQGEDREKDRRTAKDLARLIERWKPVLLMVNGDLWHDDPDGRGLEFCAWSCGELGRLGIPWAFAFGNHDLAADEGACHRLLREAAGSLYRGGETGGIYRVVFRSGAQGEVVWQAAVLNSGRRGLTETDLARFTRETRAWDAAGKAAPAFAFAHIPVPEFALLAATRRYRGIQGEEVCADDTAAAAGPALRDWKPLRAIFSGHDHLNDFHGDWDGLRLCYGRATGLNGYGGERLEKGATLVTVDAAAGRFETATVFADGRIWRPEKAEVAQESGMPE